MLHGDHIADLVTLIALAAHSPRAIVRVSQGDEVWYEHAGCIEPAWGSLYFTVNTYMGGFRLTYCRHTANENCVTCGKAL